MRHQAYCQGYLVAEVYRDKRGRWIIEWVRRGGCRERIANLDAAKQWIGQILHGKLVTWLTVRGER